MYRITGKVTRVRHASGSRERDGVTTTWHRHTYSVLVNETAIVEFGAFSDSETPRYAAGSLVDVATVLKVNRYGDGIEARLEGDWSEFAVIAPAAVDAAISELSKPFDFAGASPNGNHAKK